MNDQDLARDIDLSFGDGPPPVGADLEVEGLVRQGRRVRRGRRAGAAAGAFVVALAVGGSFLAAGGLTQRAEAPVAGQSASPSAIPSASPSDSASSESNVLRGPQLAGYTRSGELVVYPGTSVLRRVDNPAGRIAPRSSVALELEYDDAKMWWYLQRDVGSSGVITAAAGAPEEFAAWAAETADRPDIALTVLDGPGDIREDDSLSGPELVQLREDGTPDFIEGATVLRLVDNPYGLQPPSHSLAVALRWQGHVHWIVIQRQGSIEGSTDWAGDSSEFGTPGAGKTFDEFVAKRVAEQRSSDEVSGGDLP